MLHVGGVVPESLHERYWRGSQYVHWLRAGCPMPAPHSVKLKVLDRYGHARGTWVESGTYLGWTTRHLAGRALRVFTIEPSHELAARARTSLSDVKNVEVLEGLSEELFPPLLETLSGDVSFWLDGHSSGGNTHLGPRVTPIREELSAVAARLDQLDRVTVLVDDFRGFGQSTQPEGDYPPRSQLVRWADTNQLSWTVEHDIFVAWR